MLLTAASLILVTDSEGNDIFFSIGNLISRNHDELVSRQARQNDKVHPCQNGTHCPAMSMSGCWRGKINNISAEIIIIITNN